MKNRVYVCVHIIFERVAKEMFPEARVDTLGLRAQPSPPPVFMQCELSMVFPFLTCWTKSQRRTFCNT